MVYIYPNIKFSIWVDFTNMFMRSFYARVQIPRVQKKNSQVINVVLKFWDLRA